MDTPSRNASRKGQKDTRNPEQAVSIHDNSADMSLYAEQSKTFTALYKSVCKSSCPVCERHKTGQSYQRARERGIMKNDLYQCITVKINFMNF